MNAASKVNLSYSNSLVSACSKWTTHACMSASREVKIDPAENWCKEWTKGLKALRKNAC